MKNILIVFLLFLSHNLFSQQIFIPNAFTPDGDGQNDYFGVFFIEKDSIQYFSMKIYNSNGECVFLSQDIDAKWQGGVEYFSSPKPFVYFIEYRSYGTFEIIQRKGFILLIR